VAFDVVALGCACVDELIYVGDWPAADRKQRAHDWRRSIGGLSAVALVAAARLGARCAFAGVLGDDELAGFIRASLADEGIDLSHTRVVPGLATIHAAVIVGQGDPPTRNIFGHRAGAGDGSAEPVPEGLIRQARVLFVDGFEAPRALRAARVARAAGVPIVADLESDRHAELAALSDHLIVPAEFRAELPPAELAGELCSPGRQLAAVTDGANGCWYATSRSDVRRQPAFPVEARDTTGCGDVFHGAYAAALAEGMPAGQRIRFAAAAAALKAARAGGRHGVPRRAEVEALLV
jgi:sulfofructose kinase